MNPLCWLVAAVAILMAMPAAAQTNCDEGAGALNPSQASVSPDEIIRKFAGNEAVFKQARAAYTFTQDISIQTGRQQPFRRFAVTGEFRQISDISFDDHGKLIEKVTFAPKNTLANINVTREDFDDIRSLGDFIFTPSELEQYAIHYAGQQRVDELQTYAFDVGPKRFQKDHRYFDGRIWVDAQEFAIVKTCGKRVPDRHDKRMENISPRFVTYREQIDGRYWFPTYSRSDDTLYFQRSQAQLREVIKYSSYHRVASRELPADQVRPPDQAKNDQVKK